MKNIRQQLMAAAGAMLLSGVAGAVPIIVSGSITSITPGSGYGQDAAGVEKVPAGLPGGGVANLVGGQGGTLLDVAFDIVLNTFGTITLSAVNTPVTPAQTLGTIALRELFIDAAEQDNLGVSMGVSLVSPIGTALTLTATGTAIAGPVPPLLGEPQSTTDFTLVWDPLLVPFGNGGLLRIELETLAFDMTLGQASNGESRLAQHFTLTLLQDPDPAAAPEPATLALMGVGLLAGLRLNRRKRAR